MKKWSLYVGTTQNGSRRRLRHDDGVARERIASSIQPRPHSTPSILECEGGIKALIYPKVCSALNQLTQSNFGPVA